MGEMPPPNDPYRPIPYGQPYQQQPPSYGYPAPPYVPPASGYANAALWLGIVGIFFGWCSFGLPCRGWSHRRVDPAKVISRDILPAVP